MRKIIDYSKKVFLVLALIATTMGYANETSFIITANDDKLTTLTMDNVEEGNLFSIKNHTGVTIYKEQIQIEGIYTKEFDLTSLPNGDYFFELDKQIEITSIPFNVYSGIVTFNKAAKETIFKPVTVIKDNDIVVVTKLSLNLEPLKIHIYYRGNGTYDEYELVYSESIKDTKTIERAYKLSGLKEKGSYKMVYLTEGREFVKHIN